MKISRLLLRNFRNYEEEEITCHNCINIIYGMNAHGKSNLLEAISYLSLASSFRQAKDSQMLGWNQPFFYLEGEVISQRGENILSVSYTKDKKKKWKINGEQKNKLSQILGYLNTVIFSPEDLQLIKAGPSERRRFLNREMVQLYPEFCSLLIRHNKILEQRNAFLKNSHQQVDEDLLLVWDQQLADVAAKLIIQRYETIKKLNPLVKNLYHHLSNNSDQIELVYQTILSPEQLDNFCLAEIKTLLMNKLLANRSYEMNRGMTLTGPHRDDVMININLMSAKQYASQGQQRTAVLALKLAELELMYEERGEYPLLLLDDVMSELDADRRNQLLTLMEGRAQTFITGTDLNFNLGNAKKFIVVNGHVQ